MGKRMYLALVIVFLSLFPISAYAFNSFVTPEGIGKMAEAGISQQLIMYLIENQTCSLGPADLIQMKKRGMNDDVIKAGIKADRLQKPEEATAVKEAEIIMKLKEAGMSDEAILQFLNSTHVKRHVDSAGNESIVYGTKRPPRPVKGTEYPPRRYRRSLLHVIIEKDTN
jgi:hypothetical protein